MGHYIFTVAYNGRAYSGWQKGGAGKEKHPAVQEILEEVFRKTEGKPVQVRGSGRTDAGVHALGQTFDLTMRQTPVLDELNAQLPGDIRLYSVCKAPSGFHSRYSAASKIYCYRIDEQEKPCPFTRGYVYPVKKVLELERMREAASYLLGEQDFKAFCTNRGEDRFTLRTLYEIQIERSFCENRQEVQMFFRGDGFLYHMVRILAGTLLEVGLGQRRPETIKEVLQKKDRRLAGPTLPACGLWLMSVEYPGILESGRKDFS